MFDKELFLKICKNPVHFLSFGFGAGAFKYAPGTFGTLIAVPIYLLLRNLEIPLYLAVVVLLFIVGIKLCDITSEYLGVHDHSGIVWDEIVGFLITMIGAPEGWLWIVIGFIAFRIFDIWKPWPISVADKRMGGGLGIMFDDVLAGIYGWLVLQVSAYVWISQ